MFFFRLNNILSWSNCTTTVLISVTNSIKLEAVLVPKLRFRGQNATLLCRYHMDLNEELFSLKWYKDDQEFYRYTPPSQGNPTHYEQQQQHAYYGKKSGRHRGSNHRQSNRNNFNRRGFEKDRGLVQTWPVAGIKINV